MVLIAWKRLFRFFHVTGNLCKQKPLTLAFSRIQDDQGNADPAKCVKTYRRSAAGNEQPLPSDVRPAPVLEVMIAWNQILLPI